MAGLNYITASFGEEIKTWEEYHQQFKCRRRAYSTAAFLYSRSYLKQYRGRLVSLTHCNLDCNIVSGSVNSRNHIAINSSTIHDELCHTLLYVGRISDRNVVSIATELTLSCKAVHSVRNTRIYDKTIVVRTDTEDVL